MKEKVELNSWNNYMYSPLPHIHTSGWGGGGLLRSAVAGRIYKHHSKHTSNSGFDRSFMPCSGYILFAAEQRVGYQISWVDLQREVNCP